MARHVKCQIIRWSLIFMRDTPFYARLYCGKECCSLGPSSGRYRGHEKNAVDLRKAHSSGQWIARREKKFRTGETIGCFMISRWAIPSHHAIRTNCGFHLKNYFVEVMIWTVDIFWVGLLKFQTQERNGQRLTFERTIRLWSNTS
jgi:hypothetical protein